MTEKQVRDYLKESRQAYYNNSTLTKDKYLLSERIATLSHVLANTDRKYWYFPSYTTSVT